MSQAPADNFYQNVPPQVQQSPMNFNNLTRPIEATQPQEDTLNLQDNEELDPEFQEEIETYLKECMENREAQIDMSDTLIKDKGAKMVAAVASLCEDLQELRL